MNENSEFRHFCILCFNLAPTENINLFGNSERNLNLCEILSKHFWFKIDESKDNLPKTICVECWSKVESFHIFYQSVEIAHRNYFEQLSGIKYEKSYSKSINSPSNSLVENENYFSFLTDSNLNTSPCVDVVASLSSVIKCEVINEINSENEYNHWSDEDDKPLKIRCSEENRSQSVSNDTEVKSDVETSFKRKDAEERKRIADHFNMHCEICDCELPTIAFARKHYRVKHGQIGYLKCCNRKFRKRNHALEHIDWHINSKLFTCKMCAKEFDRGRALYYHMLNKHSTEESKIFTCEKCNKTFTRKHFLHSHFKVAHPDGNEKFECGSCQKTFLSEPTLRSHIKGVHERTNQHICEICGKSNISPSALRTHRLRHANAELTQITCEICGDILKNVMTLKSHMKRHTDKPHPCKYCDKVSPNRKALYGHVAKVHCEAKYKCTMCDKSFKVMLSLKEHIATHTGESLYNCPYCPQTFRSNSNMHKHKKNAHPELLAQDRAEILQRKKTKIS